MMSECYMEDKDGRYIPAIPEPFWYMGWRTLFRWKPQCCGTLFNTREAYDEHYVIQHMEQENV
jgi:hypothetical protein